VVSAQVTKMSCFCPDAIESARQLRVKGTGNYWDGIYDRVRYVRENGQPTFKQRGNPEGAIKYLGGTWWLLARGLKCLHYSKRSGKWFSVRSGVKRDMQVTVKSKLPPKAKHSDAEPRSSVSFPSLTRKSNVTSPSKGRPAEKNNNTQSGISSLRAELKLTLGHLDARDLDITKLRERISTLEMLHERKCGEIKELQKMLAKHSSSGLHKLAPIGGGMTMQALTLKQKEWEKELRGSEDMVSSLKVKISTLKATNRSQIEEIRNLRAINDDQAMQTNLKDTVFELENKISRQREQKEKHCMEVQMLRDIISKKKRGLSELQTELDTLRKLQKLTSYERDVLITKNSAQYNLIEKLKLQNSDLRKKLKLSLKAWKGRLVEAEN